MTITSVHDGSSDKFYRAWADSADGSKGFSTTDSSKEYFGVYAGTTPPSNYKAYSWTKIKGEAGRSVVDTEMEYAINDSKTTPPTTGWSLETPVWKTGLYIWQRVKVTYSTGNPSYTTPHCLESNIIEDVTGNIGDWIFRDKTEVLSGTEIFTDKADAEAVVHVEVDGKSYQEPSIGLTNLAKNGDFSNGLLNWSSPYSQLTLNSGRLNITPKNGLQLVIQQPYNSTSGNKYYVKLINGDTDMLDPHIYIGNFTMLSKDTLSAIHTSTSKSTNIIIGRTVYTNGTYLNFDSIVVIDLTQDFGAGNEPTKEQMDQLIELNGYFEGKKLVSPGNVILPKNNAPSPEYPIEIHSLNDFDVVSSVGKENLLSHTGNIIQYSNNSYVYPIEEEAFGLYRRFRRTPGENNILSNFTGAFYDAEIGKNYTQSIEVNPEKTVTLRQRSGANTICPAGQWTTLYSTITATSDSERYWGVSGSNVFDENGNGIWIQYRNEKAEEGNISTPYAPAPENITESDNHSLIDKINLLLDKPLRSVGDVKDRLFRDTDGLWKIERNVEEYIHTGLEAFTSYRPELYSPYNKACWRSPIRLPKGNIYPKELSSHYSTMNLGTMNSIKDVLAANAYTDGGMSYTSIYMSTDIVDLNEFKAWLKSQHENGTPVVHIYELETPTIEILSQPLQDKLNNLRTFKDSNYVYTLLPDKSNILSENLKPTLHATFKSIAWANDFRYKFEQSKAMHSTDIWFAKGVSNTIAPNIGWSTDAPVWEDGLYIWSKTITTYGNGRTEETSPVCITGATGRSVDKIEEWYYLSNKPDVLEGGTWSKTPPTWKDGKYIWTKNKIIYKNPSGSEETSPINTTGGSGQKGETGTDARTVRLGNIIHAVHFDQDGLMPSVSSIAFPTAIQGFSGVTPYYEFKMGDTIVRGLSTDSSWTLNTSAMKYSDFPLTVSVNVVINGQTMATDTVTIVGTKPGEDAYTVVLANESHTFVGDVSNAIAGSTTANVIAYRGGTQVGATIGSISGLPTGMTSTIYSNGTTAARVTFTVNTSMKTPNGVVNIPVTVNGKSFTKVFNYAIAFKGAKGDKGTDGVAGKDGVGIKTTVLAYASSTSGTTTPSSGWQTTVPTVAPGNYLWTRTTWTYTDNSVESGYTVSRIGKDGNTGKDGVAGKDGVGISKTVIHYASSTSGTTAPTSGWITTVPSVAQGSYLWTRTTWTYTDGTNETGYSAARMGANGATGAKGDKGNPGENATARNFLLDSKPSSIIHTAAYNIANFTLAEAPISQEAYSFVLKGELASTKNNFQIYNTDGNSWLAALSSIGNGLYVATFKWSYTGNSSLKVYANPSSVTATSKIEWVTMVKGSVPLTEWVPAHEDLQKGIDELENAVNNTSPTGENLIVNGGFENSKGHQAYGWSPSYELHSVGHSGSKALVWRAHPTTQTLTHLARVPVEPGRTYEYGYWACSSADANGVAGNNKMRLGRSDGSYLSDLGINGAVNNNGSWVKYTREYTIPNDVHEVIVSLNSNNTVGWYKIDDVFMYDITDRKSIDQKADGSATESALNEAAAKLQVLQQEIEAAATSNELKDFIDKYNKDMASRDKDARESESSLSTALASINSIQTNMGDMSATWQFVNRFIKNTPQGIVVGNDSSGSYILIKEDRLAFYSNGQEVAFISQNLMEISRGAFVEQIQIAKYQFEESTTKHLTVRFVG